MRGTYQPKNGGGSSAEQQHEESSPGSELCDSLNWKLRWSLGDAPVFRSWRRENMVFQLVGNGWVALDPSPSHHHLHAPPNQARLPCQTLLHETSSVRGLRCYRCPHRIR